jgi:hypothetical protein
MKWTLKYTKQMIIGRSREVISLVSQRWTLNVIKRMIIGMVVYAVVLLTVCHWFPEKSPHHWLVLFPVLAAIIYIAATILRAISDMDEMWRKGVTETFAFSAIATGFTCFGYRFVRETVGAPEFHAEWAFYLMWAYYGIGAVAQWLRGR